MKEKMQAKLANSEGFTLLEILVVLTIMGFLIAMVAPRLAGISGSAVDTVCDSNQSRMITMMSSYFEKTNRYPDKLTNIVEETDGAGTFQIPAVSDDDMENKAETLALEFYERNKFRIHHLNQAEVDELRELGIVNLYNLNAYDGLVEDGTAVKDDYTPPLDSVYGAVTERSPQMEHYSLLNNYAATAAGDKRPIGVMMVGGGVADTTGDTFVISSDERKWGEGDFHFRMVFGFGPENGLITSGMVSNAAHCPGGIQNADNATFNDYVLVLPRLQSTVDRFDTNVKAMDISGSTNPKYVEIQAVAYNDDPEDVDFTDTDLKYRKYPLVAMESYQYATMCPEGHKFPEDDEEFWGLDIDGDDELAE
ncbi:MAG: type II secretion system protein [Desulfobulbus sp.]|jgi:prepilin-type N-terminal cleavage/methylation domain-containing protein